MVFWALTVIISCGPVKEDHNMKEFFKDFFISFQLCFFHKSYISLQIDTKMVFYMTRSSDLIRNHSFTAGLFIMQSQAGLVYDIEHCNESMYYVN